MDGFAVGFALADLLGVGVVAALVGPAVVAGAGLDEPAFDAAALEGAALETAALDAGLETADEAAPLAMASALDVSPADA